VPRFHTALAKFDVYLASDQALGLPAEKLFQGPIAVALTHVGQMNLLRRLAGVPVASGNFVQAKIERGRVGADQSSDRVEIG
jgi:hypothetical protein